MSFPIRSSILASAGLVLSALVTTTPALAQGDWLSLVNQYRATAGLPPVSESPILSAGDAAHAQYLVLNNAVGHTESSLLPFFSAAGLAAGQASDVMESNSVSTTDSDAVNLWMSEPFHSVGIIDPQLLETGFGSYRQKKTGLQMAAALDVMSSITPKPRVALPVAWPGPGSAVPLTRYDGGETPSPLSGCPGYSTPSGLPILYLAGPWVNTAVSAYSVSTGGQPLEACEQDAGNYSNPDGNSQASGRNVLVARGAVMLIPRQPLHAGTRYDVSITVNGATRSWSFTAGAGPSPATPLSGASQPAPAPPSAPHPASRPAAPRATYESNQAGTPAPASDPTAAAPAAPDASPTPEEVAARVAERALRDPDREVPAYGFGALDARVGTTTAPPPPTIPVGQLAVAAWILVIAAGGLTWRRRRRPCGPPPARPGKTGALDAAVILSFRSRPIAADRKEIAVPVQRLSSLDSSFLHLETRNTHMHIGGIAIFDQGPWKSDDERYEALIKHVEPRLDLMPRYRQKVAFLPMNVDMPVWVDDEKFDIYFHVKRAALPGKGGIKELSDYVGRVFSRQLDRRRPLWEMYYIENIEGGHWALLTKTHHSLVDGLSAIELATVLMDTTDEYVGPRERSKWRPKKDPGTLGLLVQSLRERASAPADVVRNAVAAASNPGKLAAALAEGAGALAVTVRELTPAEGPINGPTGPTRSYWYSQFKLDEFKEIKNAFGATINDVVLGVVSGGFRKYLELHDEDVDHLKLKALCPVSLRDDKQKTALGNVLAMMIVPLPVDEPFPAARMRKAKANVDRLKASKQALGADILLKLAGFAPATLHSMVARASLKQMNYNTIVTNVPGPQWPLYLMGCQLTEAMPIAFLYEGQQVATAIFSYLGTINFGYIADRHAFPDLPRFATCMEESFAELLDVARASTAEPAPARLSRPAARKPGRAAARKPAARKPARKAVRKPATRPRRATG